MIDLFLCALIFYLVTSVQNYPKNFHTPSKKSSKINPILNGLENTYKPSTLSATAAHSKLYGKNFSNLPLGTVGSKKIYKCSESSTEPIGKVYAYGLNSNQGTVRPYNEDRVVAFHKLLTAPSGANANFWFFAVYDGHGGQS